MSTFTSPEKAPYSTITGLNDGQRYSNLNLNHNFRQVSNKHQKSIQKSSVSELSGFKNGNQKYDNTYYDPFEKRRRNYYNPWDIDDKKGTLVNDPLWKDTQKDKKSNCGFRSLSTLLTGVEDYHWHIRLKIYEYIAENGYRIYGIRSGSLANEYLRKFLHLRKLRPHPVNQNLYAGNDDFFALADMLECNIYTYTPNPAPSYPHISPHFKDNTKIPGAPTLFLMYLNNNHYEPIISFT